MSPNPFILVTPGATRGLGINLTRQFLRTTTLPVFAFHRTEATHHDIAIKILEPLMDVDPKRLNLLRLDLTSEDSIAKAAHSLQETLDQKGYKNPFIHTAFITGGMLIPEKSPAELDWDAVKDTFQINAISHVLIMKHFFRFLPSSTQKEGLPLPNLAKWIHVSACVGSITDNHRGGWYSYRSSKAAPNQAVKTFDLYLQQHRLNAMAVAMHPGTMKTDLRRGFWGSAERDELFEASDAAVNLIKVSNKLGTNQRGGFWDWSGKEIPW